MAQTWQDAPPVEAPAWQQAPPVVTAGPERIKPGTVLTPEQAKTVPYRETRSGQLVAREPTRADLVAESGLDPEAKGGSPAVRLAESVGSLEDIERALGKQFGGMPEEGFDVGRTDLGIVFRNPESGKYELLDPAGLDLGDLVTLVPEALVVAGEIVGGAIGARGGPLGIAAGAAGGAGIARGAILSALKEMGIIDESYSDIATQAGTEAAIAGGAAAAGVGAFTALSPKKRALGRLLDEGVTPERVAAGREATAGLEEATGAKLSTGQRLKEVEPEIAGRVRAAELSDVERSGEMARAKAERLAIEEREAALGSRAPYDATRVGKGITQVAEKQAKQTRTNVLLKTQREVAIMEEKLTEISGKDLATAGGDIRKTLQEGRDRVFTELSDEYERLWKQVPEETVVDLKPLRETARKWQGRIDEDIFPSLTPEDRKIVSDVLGVSDGKSIGATSRALSILKSEERLLRKNPGSASVKQKKLLSDMINDLQKAREDALAKIDPELAESIRAQDELWSEAKRSIDEALVGDVLARKSAARYRVADDNVLRSMTRSVADLKEYLRIAEKYPELNAVDDLKAALDGRYADEVINGNSTHKTWVTRNRQVIRTLYTPWEARRFDQAGKMQARIKLAEKQEKELLADLSKSFEAKVQHFEPERAVAYTIGKPSRALDMKSMLRQHPEKWKAYQDVRRERLLEDVGDSVPMLEKRLKGDARRELEITLGEDYVNNLEQLVRLKDMAKFRGADSLIRPTTEAPESLFGTIRGMIFGPLTRAGFRFRLLGRFTRAGTDDAMRRILADPDALEALLISRRQGYFSGRNAGIVAAASGSLMAESTRGAKVPKK